MLDLLKDADNYEVTADESEADLLLLNTLLHLHIRPINQVVFLDSQGRSYLGNRLALRCFQRLSVPCLATRRYCGHNNRYTRGTSFPVLSY